MMAELRQALQALLSAVPARRRPALRRAASTDALLASDLPLCADADAVKAFCQSAEKHGWTVRQEQGWLMMNHSVPRPDIPCPEALPGETGCCLSLLKRHAGGEASAEEVCALCKAGEAGMQMLERLCRGWHEDWAQRLRQGQTLPTALLPYLAAAYREAKGDENL